MLTSKRPSHRCLTLALAISIAFSSSLVSAQGQQLTIAGPVGLDLENGRCSVVREDNPPFWLVNPNFATTIDGSLNGSPLINGYLPRNTIVRLRDNSRIPGLGGPMPRTMVGVTVLSVPDRERTHLVTGGYRSTQGRIDRPGVGTGVRAKTGDSGMIRAEDVYPAIGGLASPGSVLDSKKTIFIVKRDTPFFDIPELEGRAIRLAQSTTGGYLSKRCCPPGTQTEDIWERAEGLASRYYRESTRNPNCQYTSVFELMRTIQNGQNVSFSVEKQFALPGPACDRFIAGLEPVSRSNYNAIFGAARDLQRYSNEEIERLQTEMWGEALEPRGGAPNVSKGKCRAAVREGYQDLGWLPAGAAGYPPGNEAASNYHPFLGTVGYENILSRGFTSETAPVGALLIYGGGQWGHMEAKVDDDVYCSDYCTDHPRDRTALNRPDTSRTLIGIYVRRPR